MRFLPVSHDSSLGSDFANLKKLIPNSGLSAIDNTGHIPFLENVPQLNAVKLKQLLP